MLTNYKSNENEINFWFENHHYYFRVFIGIYHLLVPSKRKNISQYFRKNCHNLRAHFRNFNPISGQESKLMFFLRYSHLSGDYRTCQPIMFRF